jgi:hypothetical protein
MTAIVPQKKLELPPPPKGWFSLSYSISFGGQLARMCTNTDVKRLTRKRQGPYSSIIPAGTLARIDAFEEGRHFEGPAFELEAAFPIFDRLSDGRWIVTDSRCPVGTQNARIVESDGTIARRFCLGDGIAHIQCDADGGTWVGYFDEGIFGNYGWGQAGQPKPMGASGVNRFDDAGRITWTYGPPGPFIVDCYAMNVASDGAWLCCYTDFSIVHRSVEDRYRRWDNRTITGATVLAVEGDYVVLVGGYQDQASRGVLLHLGSDRAKPVYRFRVDGTNGSPASLPLAVARGSEMHFVDDHAWRTMSVGDVLRQATRK